MKTTLKKAELRTDKKLELDGRVISGISQVGKKIWLTATLEMISGRGIVSKSPSRATIIARSPQGAQFYTVEKVYSDALIGQQDYSVEHWGIRYFRKN